MDIKHSFFLLRIDIIIKEFPENLVELRKEKSCPMFFSRQVLKMGTDSCSPAALPTKTLGFPRRLCSACVTLDIDLLPP